MRNSIAAIAAGLVAAALPYSAAAQQPAAPQHSVLTYHGDASRRGNFIVPALTFDKARALHLDAGFKPRVAGHLYAQPLYWSGGGSGGGMLLVATEDDVVQAFDANTGTELWRRTVGRPVPRSLLPCGNIDPLGITGTPVIDPATQAIYFDADVEQAGAPRHKVFGLSLKDGTVLPGWPIDVADALQRTGREFHPLTQNQRSALTLLDGTIYVAFGGHWGDCGDYHGWVVGLPLHDPKNVISFETRARGGGIWAPGGMSVVDHDLFFSTGNTFVDGSRFSPRRLLGAGAWSDGEAIFRVGADLRRKDGKDGYFAPSNWKSLDDRDLDLGGTNPLPLDVSAAPANQALLLALGKDGKAYLLNRNDLGGVGGQLAVATVSTTSILTAPAAYPVGADVFVAFHGLGAQCPRPQSGDDLTVLRITGGAPPSMTTAWCGAVRGAGSAMVTTTDGHSDPIVWMLGAEGDGRLHAFRGDNGAPIFVSEPLRGLRHFQTLIATQERLYVGADGRIYAFDF